MTKRDINESRNAIITVILCTYNRCEALAKALDSIARSILPESIEWEVLIIDNNSHDKTRSVSEDFCRRNPRFSYLFEPQQGKSYALNTGIREARGDVLAFVDDDVTVEPTWLQNLTLSLPSGDWAGSGGRILPAQPFSLPRWLTLEGPYDMGAVIAALFDLGETPIELDRPPYGTNMAFQKRMFDRHGLFAVDLGPQQGNQIRGEDTEFGRRLMAAGERLRYEPSAIVFHPVLDCRTQKDYLLAWWFDQGRGLMREKFWGPDVCGIPRQYLGIAKTVAAQLSVRILRWIWSVNPRARFFWKCQTWRMSGEIVESYRLAHEVRQQKVVKQKTKTGCDVRM